MNSTSERTKDLTALTAAKLGRAIRSGEATAVEAAEAYLARADEREQATNAYITICREEALAQAERIQKRIESGELTGPLAGVPVAVKDNICTKGIRTTCASRILESFVPVYSATAYEKLEEAGVVLIGKTNMDEFAMGSTSETSYFGPVRNPVDAGRVSGGSSGGSAAVVAGGEAAFALGSDTGGSIRQPASYCGIVGMKPTYGTVSRYGLIAYGSSLDQIGPLTRDVTDCALVLGAIAGHDPKDSTSVGRKGSSELFGRVPAEETAGDFASALREDVTGLRIGLPRDYFGEGLDTEVKKSVLAAAEALAERGASVEEFDLGYVDFAIPAYYTIATAEASSNLERFDGVKYGYRAADAGDLHRMYRKSRTEGFGTEVKRRIMLGSFVLSSGYYDAYYLKALKVRTLIRRAFDEAFAKYDIIVSPVAPTTAPRLGSSLDDPLKMYLGDIYTISANLAGLPAISLPCGKDSNGLPIGVQFLGDCFCEKTLLRAAYTLEQRL